MTVLSSCTATLGASGNYLKPRFFFKHLGYLADYTLL